MEKDEARLWKEIINSNVEQELLEVLSRSDRGEKEKASSLLMRVIDSVLYKMEGIIDMKIPEITYINNIAVRSPIIYTKSRNLIHVDTEKFVECLVIYKICAGLTPIETLYYSILHELGHYQLDKMGINPPANMKSPRFQALYSKFEDYAISRFLRGENYRVIEEKLLRFNALRSCKAVSIPMLKLIWDQGLGYLVRSILNRNVENISTIALAVALGYIDEKTIETKYGVPSIVISRIRLIAENLARIDRDNISKIPEISCETWVKYVSAPS